MEEQVVTETNQIKYTNYGYPEYHFIGPDYYFLPPKIRYIPFPCYSYI